MFCSRASGAEQDEYSWILWIWFEARFVATWMKFIQGDRKLIDLWLQVKSYKKVPNVLSNFIFMVFFECLSYVVESNRKCVSFATRQIENINFKCIFLAQLCNAIIVWTELMPDYDCLICDKISYAIYDRCSTLGIILQCN